jgi:ABC-type amino acid transport substrate-binding protein
LDDLTAGVHERAYHLAKRYAEQNLRADFDAWLRNHVIVAAILLAILVGGAFITVPSLLRSLIEERVTPKLDEVTKQIAETEALSANVKRRLRDNEKALSQVESFADRAQELETIAAAAASRIGDLREELRRAEGDLRTWQRDQEKQQAAQMLAAYVSLPQLKAILEAANPSEKIDDLSRPRAILIAPVSVTTENPVVVFGTGVRLEWRFARHTVGETLYRVQWAANPAFDGAKETVEALDRHELSTREAHGRTYWRVRPEQSNGTPTGLWSDVGVFELYDDVVDRITTSGTVLVGISSSYDGSFSYFDDKRGELTGLDVELARRLSLTLGTKTGMAPPDVRFVGYNWSNLLDALPRGEVDFVISTVTIKPQREAIFSIRFSEPYYETHQAAVALKGVLDGDDLRSRLANKIFAVQVNTTSVDVAEVFATPDRIKSVSSTRAAFDELRAKRVEVVIADQEFARAQAMKLGLIDQVDILPFKPSDFPEGFTGVVRERYGIAVSASQEKLLSRINEILSELRASKEIENLAHRFGL